MIEIHNLTKSRIPAKKLRVLAQAVLKKEKKEGQTFKSRVTMRRAWLKKFLKKGEIPLESFQSLNSKNEKAYRGLADVYLRQGQLDEAKETFKFVLQQYPEDDSGL